MEWYTANAVQVQQSPYTDRHAADWVNLNEGYNVRPKLQVYLSQRPSNFYRWTGRFKFRPLINHAGGIGVFVSFNIYVNGKNTNKIAATEHACGLTNWEKHWLDWIECEPNAPMSPGETGKIQIYIVNTYDGGVATYGFGCNEIQIRLQYEEATAVGAPTTIWGQAADYTNKTFLLKWSGATNGLGNTITGYHIYKDGVFYLSVSGTSATVPLATNSSGIRYTVYTIGSLGLNSGPSPTLTTKHFARQLKFINSVPTSVNYNGNVVNKIYFNNTLIWQKGDGTQIPEKT